MSNIKKIPRPFNKERTRPNKLLGQNWLRDKNVLAKIIAAANLTPNDIVLEIGPGQGILTEALAEKAGRVVAVEKDETLAALLKEKFKNAANAEIVEGDILKFVSNSPLFFKGGFKGDLKNAGKIHPNPPFIKEGKIQYKVVANIPYYLTSRLIRLLLESDHPPQEMILMVQKEVAQRIVAKPPRMSLLAVSVQFYAEAKIIANVSKKAFWPQPKVASAIIRITPYQWCHPREGGDPDYGSRVHRTNETSKCGMANTENLFRVVKAGFSHPRKQLLNNLSSGLKIPRDKITEFLHNINISPKQRAETLTVGDWIKLADVILN